MLAHRSGFWGKRLGLITGVAALSLAALIVQTREAHAGRRYFFLFVGKDEAPAQGLLESAWREADKVEAVAEPERSRELIGKAYPRLFSGARSIDRTTVDNDLKAGKAAYSAADFASADRHFSRVIDAAFESPELLASSPTVVASLADAAALRYSAQVADNKPEAPARAQLVAFLKRFPNLVPRPAEIAPDIIEVWDKVREEVTGGGGTLMVNVLPIELERSGTCRVFVNGVDSGPLPMSGPLKTPTGDQMVHVRCGLQTSWLQRVTTTDGAHSIVVPVRAMVAARAEPTSGGLVIVSPEEGDSAALVDAVSAASGFDGAVVARPGTPRRWDFGVWQPDQDAPSLLASGTVDGGTVTKVVRVAPGSGSSGGVSPWPFVVAGAGAACIIGGVVANIGYIDDRDAGKQDLDATPAAVLYGVGGALVLGGVIWMIVDLTSDDGGSTAAVRPSGPTSVVVRF